MIVAVKYFSDLTASPDTVSADKLVAKLDQISRQYWLFKCRNISNINKTYPE